MRLSRAGPWPGYRDLGFCDRDLSEYSSPVNRDELFSWLLQTIRPSLSQNIVKKWHNFCLACTDFLFRTMQIRISFISKFTSRVFKATMVVNYTSLCSTILVLFLGFHPGRRAEISHMNRQIRLEPSSITGPIWRGPPKSSNIFNKRDARCVTRLNINCSSE